MAYNTSRSTFFCPAGTKWYWEFVPTTGYNYASCGITTNSAGWAVNPGGTTDGHGVGFYNNEIDIDGTRTTPSGPASTAWASGDIIGFAYDVDANTIKKYINGSLDYTFTSVPVSTDGPYSPTFGDFGGSVAATINVNFGADSSFGGLKTAQGNQDGNEKGDFYYTPPSGYLALCTDNLSAPEIALPGENFNTLIYDDGAGAKTGVGFQPDLVWVKSRGSLYDHKLTDSVRGVTKSLESNELTAEATDSTGLTAFGADGFTVGADTNYADTTGTGMVAWNWKAGGSAVANTTGTIDALVSANTAAGFSIVKFNEAGTGVNATIGHGLSQAPELVIGKPYNAGDSWRVGSDFLTSWAYIMRLQTTVAEFSFPTAFNSLAPTSTLVNMGTDGLNNSPYESVLYCFHSVEGYSKIGSYVTVSGAATNGLGNFIYTGFKPAWFLNKMISGPDGAGGWFLYDNKRNAYNLTGTYLVPSANYADEVATQGWDFLSNGIKLRASFSANTHIYMAFAESPFKYSNAR